METNVARVVSAAFTNENERRYVYSKLKNLSAEQGGTSEIIASLVETVQKIQEDYTSKDEVAKAIELAINNIINGAPELYDTLGEIAEFIEEHKEEFQNLNSLLNGKQDKLPNGESGQILTKTEAGVEWKDANVCEELTSEELSEIFNPVKKVKITTDLGSRIVPIYDTELGNLFYDLLPLRGNLWDDHMNGLLLDTEYYINNGVRDYNTGDWYIIEKKIRNSDFTHDNTGTYDVVYNDSIDTSLDYNSGKYYSLISVSNMQDILPKMNNSDFLSNITFEKA